MTPSRSTVHIDLLGRTIVVGTEPRAWDKALKRIIDESTDTDVRLDLRHRRVVSSADLNRLISVRLQLQSAGQKIALVNVTPIVQDVLETTKLNRIFEVQPINGEIVPKLASRTKRRGASFRRPMAVSGSRNVRS